MTLTDTNDGISVTGIDRYYMASSSSSGITVDSQGWKPDPQETNPISRYHWSYEVVKYSDGAKIPSKPAIIGVYGKEGVDAVTVSLSSEAHTFAGTESKAIASSLSIDIIAFKGNQRISTSIGTVTGGISGQLTHSELGRGTTNNKLVINVTNALNKSHGTLSIPIVADGKTFNKVFSWSVAFKGKPGDKGDKGDTGDKGVAGTGIKSSEISYVIHTNGTTAPTLGWVSTVPAPKQGRYLWTRTITTYTDNTTSTTYSVAYQATNGQQGAAGNGVSSTTVTYAQTTSGTTTPTSWSSTRPAPIKGQYLWSRTIIKYTNGSSSTAYNTSYSATDGQKGDKGDTGPRGPQGIQGPSGSNGQSQWVHIRYSPNSTGSGMTTNPSSTTKYVGIAVTNSATAPVYTGFTWSKYVGEDGSRGPQGLPGQKGDDGTTTYTWIRYADTPTSGMSQYPDGKKYIGMAFNKTTQTESSNYNDYQWSLMPQNIEIGGRNLLRNSGEKVSNGNYNIASYDLTDEIKEGEEVTLTIWGSLAATKSYFSAYNSGGSVNVATLTNNGNGTYSRTFKWKIGSSTNTFLNVYAFTNAQTGVSTINKIKLEKGNVTTDWTPAPEDVEAAYTAVAQAKAEAERIKAESYADGKVTAEEEARIADAEAKLAAAKEHADKISKVQDIGNGDKKFINVGNLATKPSSVTGYLVIKTPLTSPYMTKMKVSGYNYRTGETDIDISVSFYAYINNAFHNYSFISSGNYSYNKVQLARDSSGKTVVIIGNQSDAYSYPKISIDEVLVTQGNPPDSFKDGFSAEIVTDISMYTNVVSIPGYDTQSQIDKSVKTTDVEYYLSTSSTSLAGGSWQTTAPAWVNGRYMWSRTKVVLNDGTTSYNPSVTGTNITGAKGSTGGTGATGRGISSIVEQFYLSDSKTTQTGGSWSTTMPTWSVGKYVWTRSLITYTTGTPTTSTTEPLVSSEWEAVNEIEIGGRNYAKGTSNEFTYVTTSTYSGSLTEAGATSQNTYTLDELGAQAGDTMTVSMYVGESAEGYGGGLRIDDQHGQNVYSTLKTVKNAYVSETFTILEGTTQISLYTTSYGQSGASKSFKLPVRELKLERGNKVTGWSPAPEDVEDKINDKASAEDLTDVSNDLNTSIGDLSNTVDGKVDKSTYEEFLEHNANIQEQLSTSTANAQEDITKALARTATVEQKLGEGAADWIFTHTQIRMSDEGITLGEQGSGSYLQITNDQISFFNGSKEPVAFINGGMLNINHAIFVESIQISQFMFSSEVSGHLTLRYVGN